MFGPPWIGGRGRRDAARQAPPRQAAHTMTLAALAYLRPSWRRSGWPSWLFPDFVTLQPYSKIDLKKNVSSSIYSQYPIMTKHIFANVWKIKTETSYLHKYSDPLLWDSKLSSGASCFHWSSLRCFYNLIWVHLWLIQLWRWENIPEGQSSLQLSRIPLELSSRTPVP